MSGHTSTISTTPTMAIISTININAIAVIIIINTTLKRRHVPRRLKKHWRATQPTCPGIVSVLSCYAVGKWRPCGTPIA